MQLDESEQSNKEMIILDKQEELQFFAEVLDSYEYDEQIHAFLDRLHKLGIGDSEILKYLKENNRQYILKTVQKIMSILDNYKNNHYLFEELITLSKTLPRNKTSILNTMDKINDNGISDDEILDVIFNDFDENDHYDFISSLASFRESKLAEIEAERLFKLEEEQKKRDRENNSKNKEEHGSFIKEFFTEILPVIIIVILIISYGLKSCSNSSTYYEDDYEETFYRGR